MAFAAAAAGRSAVTETINSPTNGEITIPMVSQKVWTLVQTCISLESLSGGIGSANDTTNLRQRLQTTENTGISLQTDIENNLKKLRVGNMNVPSDNSNQKQLKRLEEQYNEVRERFIKDVNESRIKRRQFTPQDLANKTNSSSSSSSTTTATTNPSSTSTTTTSSSKRKMNTKDLDPSQISIQMQNFTEVDAALIEVSNEGEYIYIAEGRAKGIRCKGVS